MRTRAAVVAAIVAVVVGAMPATASPAVSSATTAVRPVAAASDIVTGPALDILTRANAARANAGLAALTIDASLTQVAQAWTDHMAATSVLAHNPSNSAQIPAGWLSWGENVGWTQPASSSRLHDAWMASPGHRANLLNSGFTHVGIGWTVDANGRSWATQVFARYPSSIDLPQFADVPVWTLFHDDIAWVVDEGIATGYVGGTFKPSAAVTREAMAAFLYRAITGNTIPACSGDTREFTDVPASNIFCGAIEWLAGTGITTGWPDGTFRPSQAVTREATAAFLYRAMNTEADPTCDDGTRRFADVVAASILCGTVEWLAGTGITTGWPDGTFRPTQAVTREAMAAFLHRAFG